MKIAFNILPVNTDYEHMHLLIEAGSYGVSFIWFTKEPYYIQGISVYQLTEKCLPGSMADAIENMLHLNPAFNKTHASVTICYDFKESLLIPEDHYKPLTAEAMLNLVYATGAESNIKSEPVIGFPVHNVYAIHKKIENVFSQQFPKASVLHATCLQLQLMKPKNKLLYSIFFHNSIKVFLFDGPSLQLVQYFNYITPVDAAYHLLNCCEQYDTRPEDVSLLLSGMIDEKSKLFAELYGYFLNIEFENTDQKTALHERITFYPSHFFSHLTGLAVCVS